MILIYHNLYHQSINKKHNNRQFLLNNQEINDTYDYNIEHTIIESNNDNITKTEIFTGHQRL